MKNLFYSLVVLLSVVSFSFGQDMSYVAVSNGKAALVKSKTSGEFDFKFDPNRAEGSVEKAASFYEKHFSVDYNSTTGDVKIKMKDNEPSSRMIVARFLSYNQTRYIDVDGEEITMSDFIDLYLK